jgi:hypothetical protein
VFRIPKGIPIPNDKLVRAYQKGWAVLPDGGLRFDSAPLNALLEPYTDQIDRALEVHREFLQSNWRRWDELLMKGEDSICWIQFSKTIRKLHDAATSASS